MPGSESPWFWHLLAASGVFALGYAARGSLIEFALTAPLAIGVTVFGYQEATRLQREERKTAVDVAIQRSVRASHMDPIT